MADIHIGEITEAGQARGKVRLVYHIPIDSPKDGIVPTPTSSIEDILDASEIAALASGELAEVIRTVAVDRTTSQSDIVAALRNDWQNIKTDYNEKYNFKYKFFGNTINVG